jgi:hypothetical protein
MTTRSTQAKFYGAEGEVDALEAIVPIVHGHHGRFEIIGTGFFILKQGVMLTASHVLQTFQNGDDLFIVQKRVDVEKYDIRRIVRARAYEGLDVGIAVVEPIFDEERRPVECRTTSPTMKLPQNGERVWAYGFPQSMVVPPNLSFDGPSFLIERDAASGLVTENYPQGRDSVMQPSACLEISMDMAGGASGGPVMNEAGAVFGVVSSGIDGGPTYAAPIQHVMAQPMIAVNGDPQNVLSPWDYLQKFERSRAEGHR